MTKEEAINIIKMAEAEVEWEYPMEYSVAFDVAIECIQKCMDRNEMIFYQALRDAGIDVDWETVDKAWGLFELGLAENGKRVKEVEWI